MKRLLTTAMLAMMITSALTAQKRVYIPDEWRQNRTDTLLYKESDPDNKYTWSKTRSVESDNVVIFWDKYYGSTNPKNLPKSNFYYVDIDDLLAKCEAFFDLEINQLGFVDPVNSNLSKYKVMVLMNHTTEWTCFGGGYDFEVSALWLNPSTCKPVGHSVAHEVGHSFHYMCYAEACGHNHWSSSTIGTGFHLPVGNGQTIWEQTAQWQANQSYPELMYDQSIGIFRNSHNYAFTHEWHRYQSYWFLYYLCQHYGDIKTVAQVWNQPMTGATDFNQALMALKGLSVRDLYQLYFDYACRCATWDFDVCVPYRNPYVGDFTYRCVLTDDDAYQVALSSCPQGTGFNVVPLQVPQGGTEVTTHLTGLTVGAALLDADPGEYLDGDSRFVVSDNRHYINGGTRSARGFRMGYVALMKDGTRRYFSEDSVYCQGTRAVTEDFTFTVPDDVSALWLVVSPALKSYHQHKWDDKIDGDDMWPYKFSLEGTDIATSATVYAEATLDGRDIADVTFTYDVTIPRTTGNDYSGVNVAVSGRAASTLGTAFQMQPSNIATRLQTWSAQGPANNRIMFYAVNPNGSLAQSGSTANGYGHWFNASGNVTSYSAGYVYSEFTPSALTFYVGQYPGKCQAGSQYTIRQALRYRRTSTVNATATFVFNITIGDTDAVPSVMLRSTDYADPTVQGITDVCRQTSTEGSRVYDLTGRRLTSPSQKGINIVDGRKVVVR
ncbi:MAG: DUF4859 domain-containing protein [Prevotella sp.]|nr:DUF4859 domain-containing protein [Prevotella sp.]